jgi:type IV pilus assembly protein PilV
MNLRHTPRAQSGVSLIEVLISVLVVSIGLLGAAAMQATAVRNNQGSYERTQVTLLTQSIFDAMRGNNNGTAAANGDYNLASMTCTAPSGATLAASDLSNWISALKSQIGSTACGQVNCSASRSCTVTIQWNDSRATGGSSAQTISITGTL